MLFPMLFESSGLGEITESTRTRRDRYSMQNNIMNKVIENKAT